MVHGEALISVSVALSQTPAEAAKSADKGLVCRMECLFSSQRPSLRRLYQFILVGEQRQMCMNNLLRVARGAERPGLEPAMVTELYLKTKYSMIADMVLNLFLIARLYQGWTECSRPRPRPSPDQLEAKAMAR